MGMGFEALDCDIEIPSRGLREIIAWQQEDLRRTWQPSWLSVPVHAMDLLPDT